MTRLSTSSRTPLRAWILALLVALSVAEALEGVCAASGSSARYLWLEVVSCSDQVLREVSDELFRQALEGTYGDFTGVAAGAAAALVRKNPGLLIVGRVLAFADTDEPFSVRDPSGKYSTAVSDRPFEWRRLESEDDRRYFLGATHATCAALQEEGRIVVRRHSNCCDTGRSGEIGCVLEVPELRPSQKAPPTDSELAATGIEPTRAAAAPAGPIGAPKPR